MTITPASNLASAVVLSCGGSLPVGYACGFTPTIINLANGQNGNFTLSLTPTASGASPASMRAVVAKQFNEFPFDPGGFVGFGFLTGLASLPFFAASKRSLRRRLAARLIMISGLSFALGCGSSGGGGGMQPTPTPTSTTVLTGAPKVASLGPNSH